MVTRRLRTISVVIIAVALIAAGWSITCRLVALEYADSVAGIEGANLAIRWDQTNPDFLIRRSRIQQDELSSQNYVGAGADLRLALDLHPYNWWFWRDWARFNEHSQNFEAAEAAFLRALQLSPRNGVHHWDLGNFYLRRGRLPEALTSLKEALRLEPAYLEPGSNLLLRLGLSAEQIEGVWPERENSGRELLRSWVETQKGTRPADPSLESFIWELTLRGQEPVDPVSIQSYMIWLDSEQRYSDLRQRWIDLALHNQAGDEDFVSGRNLVWNGRFEQAVDSGFFSWALPSGEGVRAFRAGSGGKDSSAGAQIELTARRVAAIDTMRQIVILQPNQRYSISCDTLGNGLARSIEAYVELLHTSTGRRIRLPRISDSVRWQTLSTTFETGTGEERWLLGLRGEPQGTRDLRGIRISIDNVEVRPEGASRSD